MDRILEILDLININADSPNLIKSFTPITPIPNLSQSASCCSIFVYFRPVILAIINRFKDQTKHEDVQVLISTRSPQSRLECLDTKAQWDAGKKKHESHLLPVRPIHASLQTCVLHCTALHPKIWCAKVDSGLHLRPFAALARLSSNMPTFNNGSEREALVQTNPFREIFKGMSGP